MLNKIELIQKTITLFDPPSFFKIEIYLFIKCKHHRLSNENNDSQDFSLAKKILRLIN